MGGLGTWFRKALHVIVIGLLAGCQIESKDDLVKPQVLPSTWPENFTFETVRLSEDRQYLDLLEKMTFHSIGGGIISASGKEDGSSFTIQIRELPEIARGLYVASYPVKKGSYFYSIFTYRDGNLTIYPLNFDHLSGWLALDREASAAQQRLLKNPPNLDATKVQVSDFEQLQDWARFAYEFSAGIGEPDKFRLIEIAQKDLPDPEHWSMEIERDVITGRTDRRAYLAPVQGREDAVSYFQVECEGDELMIWLVSEDAAYQHILPNVVFVEMRVNDRSVIETLFAQGLAPGEAHVPIGLQALQLKSSILFRPDLRDVHIITPWEFLLMLSLVDELVLRVRSEAGTALVSVFKPKDSTGRLFQHMANCK